MNIVKCKVGDVYWFWTSREYVLRPYSRPVSYRYVPTWKMSRDRYAVVLSVIDDDEGSCVVVTSTGKIGQVYVDDVNWKKL